MNKKLIEKNKNENYEKLKKIYSQFASKISNLRFLLARETKIYDYMRNCFINSEDGNNYSIVSAVNDALIEITNIGEKIFLKYEDYWREEWFFLTAFLYFNRQTFENLIKILGKSKVITIAEYKKIQTQKLKTKNIEAVNFIRKLLHHTFNTYIKYEDLESMKDILKFDQDFLNKLKDLKGKKINFALVNFHPENFFSEECSIHLEVMNFKDKYSKDIFIKFNLYNLLNNYFKERIELINFLLPKLIIFARFKRSEFKKTIKSINSINNTASKKLENLKEFIFSKNFLYKDSNDLGDFSQWISKNILLNKFLHEILPKNSLLIKFQNIFLTKSLKFLAKDINGIDKFQNKIEDNFNSIYSKYWEFLGISYGYFSEKINSDYIVIFEHMNYIKDEINGMKYFLADDINPCPSIKINKTIFDKNHDALIAQKIYLSYINFFEYLIKHFIKDKKIIEEISLVFNANINSENILNNWLVYELLMYVLTAANKK